MIKEVELVELNKVDKLDKVVKLAEMVNMVGLVKLIELAEMVHLVKMVLLVGWNRVELVSYVKLYNLKHIFERFAIATLTLINKFSEITWKYL